MDQKDQKIWQKKRNAKKSQKKQDEFDEFIGPYLRHLKYTVRIRNEYIFYTQLVIN